MKKDWSKSKILFELREKGTTLTALSRGEGLASRTLNNAFYRPYPKAEKIISSALGVEPSDIWPSRYLGESYVAYSK